VLGRGALAANLLLIRVSKTLFSYQIYVRAKTTPDVEFLLREAKQQSEVEVQRLRSPASVRPHRASS
jgi:hypothetical protein